jgi:hypothetical protein
LARALGDEFEVYIADYSYGYMARNMPTGAQLIAIDLDPQFPADAVVVFQAFLPWRFPFVDRMAPDNRLMFWALHPKNLDPGIFNEQSASRLFSFCARLANRFAAARTTKLRAAVQYLLASEGMVFQDRESIRSLSALLGIAVKAPCYLPVPLPGVALRKDLPHKNEIVCAWIGRICDFKYSILEHVIRRLEMTANSVAPVRLLVVGTGDYLNIIERTALEVQSGRYSIEFLGNMAERDIPQFLVERVDFLFAMGTSALEGARLGIPVFLTDYSYQRIVGLYRFRYLHDNSGYCLGEEIFDQNFEPESSLELTLAEGLKDYQALSMKSYQYWQENFSLEEIIREFRLKLLNVRSTFGDMVRAGYFQSDLLGRILRGLATLIRTRGRNECVGFRSDC